MWRVSSYEDKAVKEICYNCGSPTAKQSYNYFRRIHYVTGGKVWSKVWSKVTEQSLSRFITLHAAAIT